VTDTPDLAALVPGLMARRPDCTWAILSEWVLGEDLMIGLGHGYRNLTSYRLRMLLAANGQRTYRRTRQTSRDHPQRRSAVTPSGD
jgi:hypothetical protein